VGSVRFYKLETEKTEPNRTQTGKKTRKKTESKPKKPSQTRKNRAKTSRFEPVSVWFEFFLKKTFGLVTFFKKNNRIENNHS
jgi:hypothetical protein